TGGHVPPVLLSAVDQKRRVGRLTAPSYDLYFSSLLTRLFSQQLRFDRPPRNLDRMVESHRRLGAIFNVGSEIGKIGQLHIGTVDMARPLAIDDEEMIGPRSASHVYIFAQLD